MKPDCVRKNIKTCVDVALMKPKTVANKIMHLFLFTLAFLLFSFFLQVCDVFLKNFSTIAFVSN